MKITVIGINNIMVLTVDEKNFPEESYKWIIDNAEKSKNDEESKKEENYTIKVNLELGEYISDALNKVLSHRKVKGINSYKSLYMLFSLLKTMKIPIQLVIDAFTEFELVVDHGTKLVVEMDDHDYLYKVFRLVNDEYDFPICSPTYYVEIIENPYESMVGALKIAENLNERLEIVEFYDRLENYMRMKTIIKKKQYGDYFVENMGKISNEILFTNSNYDLIKCDKLAKTKHTYKLGDSMVVNHDEFVRRFNLVTNNMMLGDFPWDVSVVAGGMVSLLLDVNFDESLVKSSDIDIFIIGKEGESKKDSFKRVLDWFDKSGRTVYSVVGSVCTVYVPKVDDVSKTDLFGADRYFQLISINVDNYQDVINRFDLTHIQVCYNGVEVYATYKAVKAMMERVTVLWNSRRTNIDRMIKSLYRGWNIEKCVIIKSECEDLEYYSNNPDDFMVQRKIRKCHSYNYLHVSKDVTEEEKHQLMDVMDKYTCGNMITMSAAKVMENMVIGGNFESSYDVLNYEHFKLDSLERVDKNKHRQMLYSCNGLVKLLSDECMVVSIQMKMDDENEYMCIILQVVSKEFKEFMEMLDNKVIKHITNDKNKNTTKKLLNDGIFMVKLHKINTKKRDFEMMYLRNANMDAINLMEELKVYDSVKVMFRIELINYKDECFYVLKPVVLIKCNNDAEVDLNNNRILLDDESPNMMQNPNTVVKLVYERPTILVK